MPAFFEFLLIALLIFLWESVLWLPRQGLALRKSPFGNSWRAIPAVRFLTTRNLGAVPLMPIPADTRIFPCSGLPLVVDDDGEIHIDSPSGIFFKTGAKSWEDIRFSTPNLLIGNRWVRCQSPETMKTLRKYKRLGLSPGDAIRRAWKVSLSPPRAAREIERWKITVSSLKLYCPLLWVGFFVGLPAAYLISSPISALWLGAWLWCLMLAISIKLFTISKNILPSAKSDIRQDALLSLIIPFHAMRAAELTAVHAFAATHPAAILLAHGAMEHPWLGQFARSLRFPRPAHSGDMALAQTALAPLEKILSQFGIGTDFYLSPPDLSGDSDAAAWCPRCHGIFLSGVDSCRDCGGLSLREFRQITQGP